VEIDIAAKALIERMSHPFIGLLAEPIRQFHDDFVTIVRWAYRCPEVSHFDLPQTSGRPTLLSINEGNRQSCADEYFHIGTLTRVHLGCLPSEHLALMAA
jgi:hypothetical protein